MQNDPGAAAMGRWRKHAGEADEHPAQIFCHFDFDVLLAQCCGRARRARR